MTKNRKKGITLLVVSLILFITAVNMYYNFDYINNLLDPVNPIDEQSKHIIQYIAMFDTLIGIVLFGTGMYFIKKDDGIK